LAQELTLTIAAGDLIGRIGQRLVPGAPASKQVVWLDNGDRVLIHGESLNARLTGGWLICDLDLEAAPSGKQTVQFIYFLGNSTTGDGLNAGCTINAPTAGAAQLADRWGATVQRVIWDAVLDAVEACLFHAGTQSPGQTLTLAGFNATDTTLNVNVLTGEL
jgi:hypothetical protein